jgi:hypothetical protein
MGSNNGKVKGSYMSLSQILKQQWEMLHRYGFDGETLHFPSAPRRFRDHLENVLKEKMHWSQYVNVPKEIHVDIPGLFNNENDLVHFRFHYDFDAINQAVSLVKISARLRDTRLDFPVAERDAVLPSHQIYEALAKELKERPVQENQATAAMEKPAKLKL